MRELNQTHAQKTKNHTLVNDSPKKNKKFKVDTCYNKIKLRLEGIYLLNFLL